MTTYNPMNNEFKEEAKRLGLTGNQLTAKYKREKKFLEKSVHKYKPKIHTYYNETNTCPNIKEDGSICGNILRPHYALKERDKNGKETGRWLCKNCQSKYDPNGNWNLLRSVGNRRTGNLDQDSSCAKGDNFQELTSIWRSTLSTIFVEDLNKKLDNYTIPIDHSPDSELGIIQTKGRLYNPRKRRWSLSSLEREWDKIFDHEICYCTNEDGTLVERIYIFPKEEIVKVKSIDIIKNPTYRCGSIIIPWYEEYRIKDEETINKVNDIWKEILRCRKVS